jgi:alpha-D-ribose 1-methylphosphonate 5-phosphate C-P lyase
MDLTTSTLQAVAAWGTGGVVVVMIIIGLLDPKRVTDQLRRDVEGWKAMYEKECTAHQETRRAHENTMGLLHAQLEKERDRIIDYAAEVKSVIEFIQRQEEQRKRGGVESDQSRHGRGTS